MKQERKMTAWYGRLKDAEKYPDIEYWRAQPHEVVFDTVWQMVVEAHLMKGEDLSESRLQRSIGGFHKRRG
ncbi:MAG: hypothetical protein UZ17_ACD001002774 [Acidobacteria bacterium OLB17]|nr:MAG: hypothetical protein UZ17_ACD001002774 [Acidobacteria bacterium OLB17]